MDTNNGLGEVTGPIINRDSHCFIMKLLDIFHASMLSHFACAQELGFVSGQ
jgi:hypothetical protein